MGTREVNLWPSAEHALDYLRRADSVPHRVEGEATLLEFVPASTTRVLDLGSGAGRLLSLVLAALPSAEFVALDFSPTMLHQLRGAFRDVVGSGKRRAPARSRTAVDRANRRLRKRQRPTY